MEDHVRAALAYIAGRLVSGMNSSGVYDHSRSRLTIMNGEAKGHMIAIFDHDQKCHISGSGNGLQYSLFHHGERRAISLTLQGSDFSGHDYGRSTRFSGTVEDNSILLIETATCRQFRYSLAVSLEPPWSDLAGKADIEPDQANSELPPV